MSEERIEIDFKEREYNFKIEQVTSNLKDLLIVFKAMLFDADMNKETIKKMSEEHGYYKGIHTKLEILQYLTRLMNSRKLIEEHMATYPIPNCIKTKQFHLAAIYKIFSDLNMEPK